MTSQPPPAGQMRAVRYERYGPPEVIQLRQVETPAPADDEVLVKVQAASVNPLDWHSMRGLPYVARLQLGVRKPSRGMLGADLAGIVETVGGSVTGYRMGDEVFGTAVGTLAEYVAVPQGNLAPKPPSIGFGAAAAVPVAGLTALQSLRDKAGLESGHRVLVNGAAGGVGTFAVQIARSFGAEVTGVCSTPNVELVRSIGAYEVVDYNRDDFARTGHRYDLILDAVGNRPISDLRRALAPSGTLVMIGPGAGKWIGPMMLMLKAATWSRFVDQRMLWFLSQHSHDDLVALSDLIEAGKVSPVIDRTYRLAEVAEAIAYLEEGHARGKVVISV